MSLSQLQLEDVTVRFGGIVGLNHVNVSLAGAEVVGVVGALGAGKSTLLRVAAGALAPTSGRVVFDGAVLGDLAPGEAARRGLLLVPAGGGIFPTLTVRENLQLAERGAGTFPSDAVAGLFSRFPILGVRPGQVAGSLSGGEQRQLALARAALAAPRVLLLDEPLLGLAPHVASAVARLVSDLAQRGTGVLIVEERPTATLSALAQRLIGLQLGRIVPAGTAERIEVERFAAVTETRANDRVEVQAVRVPLTVAEKRALQTQATESGETVGELLARLAREHITATSPGGRLP